MAPRDESRAHECEKCAEQHQRQDRAVREDVVEQR